MVHTQTTKIHSWRIPGKQLNVFRFPPPRWAPTRVRDLRGTSKGSTGHKSHVLAVHVHIARQKVTGISEELYTQATRRMETGTRNHRPVPPSSLLKTNSLDPVGRFWARVPNGLMRDEHNAQRPPAPRPPASPPLLPAKNNYKKKHTRKRQRSQYTQNRPPTYKHGHTNTVPTLPPSRRLIHGKGGTGIPGITPKPFPSFLRTARVAIILTPKPKLH